MITESGILDKELLGQVCVCILAHNEEKHIASTIKAILEGNSDLTFDLKVYANGCTDSTVEIVKKLSRVYSSLELRELEIASKILTWNIAFSENLHNFIIFSDGDIKPEPGAIAYLVRDLKKNPQIVVASCQQIPLKRGLNWQQRLVGLMQISFMQDFLGGGFYAVRRDALAEIFKERGLVGIPTGVTGEDEFIGNLIGHKRLLISEKRYYYEPPDLRDYCLYLARMRWQERQLKQVFRGFLNNRKGLEKNMLRRAHYKLKKCDSFSRCVLGLSSIAARYLFKFFSEPVVNKYYKAIGPVGVDGSQILSQTTRSQSSK